MRGIVLGCAMLMVTTMVGGETRAADGWVALFDGRTLDGWVQRNGTATYRVTDGAIVGRTSEGSPNSFLATEQAYGDFELEFEVKVDDALNSGVQIRSRTRERPRAKSRTSGRPGVRAAGRDRGEPGPCGLRLRRGDGPRLADPGGARRAACALPERGVEPLPHRREGPPHPDLDQRRADRGPDRHGGLCEPRRGLHRPAGAQHRAAVPAPTRSPGANFACASCRVWSITTDAPRQLRRG